MVLLSTLLTLIQSSPTQEQQQLFKPRFTLHKHSSFVNCVRFSPDGKQLYTAGRDAKLNIWNLKNGQLQSTRRDHTDSIDFIVVSPTKTQFLTGARDGTLKFWKTKDASLKHSQSLHQSQRPALRWATLVFTKWQIRGQYRKRPQRTHYLECPHVPTSKENQSWAWLSPLCYFFSRQYFLGRYQR